jgi:hypothetical protein
MSETGYISKSPGPLLGERVDRDGAFTSRRGSGEGSVARPADRSILKRKALQTARPRSPSFPRPSFVSIDIPGLFRSILRVESRGVNEYLPDRRSTLLEHSTHRLLDSRLLTLNSRLLSTAFPNSTSRTPPGSATGIRADARAYTPAPDGGLREKAYSTGDENLVDAVTRGKDLECGSAELSVNLVSRRGHGRHN